MHPVTLDTSAEKKVTALVVAADGDSLELVSLLRAVGLDSRQVDIRQLLNGVNAPVSLCLVDLRLNGDAIRATRAIRSQQPDVVVIGVADPARPSAAAEAIRAGVFDVLPRPASPRDLEALLANAREQAAMIAASPSPPVPELTRVGVVGPSASMRVVMDLARHAASGRCGVLIAGERGSGREMVARAVHAYGSRPDAPFVKVECSGPTPGEIELELFGPIGTRPRGAELQGPEHVGRDSRLMQAAGGILFLENVVELPERVQARLARVFEDHEVQPDDGREAIALDVRPIASADRLVDAALDDGRLRKDFYERISLVRIDVPALRQRREDVPVLACHFLKEACRANGQPIKTFTRPALTLLAGLPWRGNTPELRSLVERLILLVPTGLIRLEDVLAHTQLDGTMNPAGVDATLRQARAKFERDYVIKVLQHHRGRIADAAKVLGIQRTNLYRKMRRLNLTLQKPAAREW